MKEIKEETSTRSRLRNLLVLLSRIAAIAALVLAFAQPFIPSSDDMKSGRKAVGVFVDNSFSMKSLSEDVSLLDKAKFKAREIISAHSADDEFQVLTNDFEGRHQRLVSQEDALSFVDEINISPNVKKLSNVLSRQRQALETSSVVQQISYIISDFQKNISDIEAYQDTSTDLVLIPLQSVQEKNISIDSAWFTTPVQIINQTNSLVVKVVNHSAEDIENIRLSFQHQGQEKPIGSLSIPANGRVIDTVDIPVLKTGWHEGVLKITDYPIQFDDDYYITFKVAERMDVLVINDGSANRYLDAAFKGLNYFKLTNSPSSNINYSGLKSHNLIIVNELKKLSSGLAAELSKYVKAGGNLLLFPSKNAGNGTYNSLLKELGSNEYSSFDQKERKVARINTSEFVFKDVFENRSANLRLPTSKGNYQFTNYAGRGAEKLLIYRDGSTYLGKYKSMDGHLYVCAAPLNIESNDLVKNAEIFIPMLYKMALSSAKASKIAYGIGEDDFIEVDNLANSNELVYKMKGSNDEFIPAQTKNANKVVIGVNESVKEAGFYNLYLDANNAQERLAFNYDRTESQISFLNTDELAQRMGSEVTILDGTAKANLSEIIDERSRGTVLWRWCIILALLFLLLETLLLRIWKVQ